MSEPFIPGQLVKFVDCHGLGKEHGIENGAMGIISIDHEAFEAYKARLLARYQQLAQQAGMPSKLVEMYRSAAVSVENMEPQAYGPMGYSVKWDDGRTITVQAVALEAVPAPTNIGSLKQ